MKISYGFPRCPFATFSSQKASRFTLLDVFLPSDHRDRDAQTPASSHLAPIPRSLSKIDDVSRVWLQFGCQMGRGGLWKTVSCGAGLSCQLRASASSRRGNCKHGPRAKGDAGLAGDAQAEGTLSAKININIWYLVCVSEAAAFLHISIPASDLLCHLRQIV